MQRSTPTPSLLHPRTSISSRAMYSTTGSVLSTLPGIPSQRISPTGVFDARSTSPSTVLSTMKPSLSSTAIVASDQPSQTKFLAWWPWSKQVFTASVASVAVLLVFLVCLFIMVVRCTRARRRKAQQSNLKVSYSEDQSPAQNTGVVLSLDEDNELEMMSVKSSEPLRGYGAARETPGNGRVLGISNPSFLPLEREISQDEEHYVAMLPFNTSKADTVKDDQRLLNAGEETEQIYENVIDPKPAGLGDNESWPPTENQEETYSYANKESLLAELMKANLGANCIFLGNTAAPANVEPRPRTWVPVGRSPQISPALAPRAKSCDSSEKHLTRPNKNQGIKKDSTGEPTRKKAKSEPVDRGEEPKAFDEKQKHSLVGNRTEKTDSGCSEMWEEEDTPLYQNVGSLFQSPDHGPGYQAVERERASEEEMYDEVPQCDNRSTRGSPEQIYENMCWT